MVQINNVSQLYINKERKGGIMILSRSERKACLTQAVGICVVAMLLCFAVYSTISMAWLTVVIGVTILVILAVAWWIFWGDDLRKISASTDWWRVLFMVLILAVVRQLLVGY